MLKEGSRRILSIGGMRSLGGITVFCERWVALQRRLGRTVTHVLPRSPSAIAKARLATYDEIVLNSTNPFAVLAFRLLFPCTRMTVVDHNASRWVAGFPGWKKSLHRIALSRVDQVALVSAHLSPFYSGRHLELVEITTALPPDRSKGEDWRVAYSEQARALLSSDRPVLALPVGLAKGEAGNDLYGFNAALDVVDELRETRPEAALLIVVSEWVDDTVTRQVRARLTRLGPEDGVYLEEGCKPFWPVLDRIDVVLRPTMTDGNSLTIHEALWAGCPIVASDVAPRPAGCLVYRQGDAEHFLEQIEKALSSPRTASSLPSDRDISRSRPLDPGAPQR